MSTLKQDIEQTLTQCMAEIRANMASKGINASGKTSAAFAVESGNGFVRLVKKAGRNAPVQTLEVGRPGGNVPGGFRTTKAGVRDVSNVFKAILIEWAQAKGIAHFGWGQATMLGRKIAAQGTDRYRNHEDVLSTPVNTAVKRIKANTYAAFMAEIQEQIKTNF